jgi:hypothetical protein
MADTLKIDLHNPVPFSRSPYWGILREYYQQEGPKAWNEKIPYYVTSNMNLAYSYAECLVAYYLDWTRENGASSRPLHIVELGAGSARFSYCLLLALEEVATINKLKPSCFKLILSDFVEENIRHWLGHKQFEHYFNAGLLDCIQFDVQSSPSMMCLHSRKKLTLDDFAIPPFFIAHYLLDSLPIDVFQAKGGQAHAVHVGLGVDKSLDFKKGDIRRLTFEKRSLRIKDAYYRNKLHNDLVKSAADKIQDGYFEFPITVFKLLDRLGEMAGGQFIFSCMDKGYVDWSRYQGSGFPQVFYHDRTFSFDVNFCVLNEYLQRKENYSLWFGTRRQLLKWELCNCGVTMNETPEMDRFIQLRLENGTPMDYSHFYGMANNWNFDLPFEALVSLLVQSCWDPVVFVKMGSQLVRKINSMSYDERGFLFSYLHTIEKNFFHALDSGDIYLVIGRLYHAVGEYEDAISYLERSKTVFGENYAVYFALGRSYFSAGDSASAISMFAAAQGFKVTKQLKSWLDYFNTESTYAKSKARIEKKRELKAKKKAEKKRKKAMKA